MQLLITRQILHLGNPLHIKRAAYLLLLLILATAKLVRANELPLSCNEKIEQCTKVGEWNFSLSIGVGLRSNPLFESDNIPLVILPEFSYYAEHFFIENLDIGYNLIDSSRSSLNIIATPSYDSVFFNRWDPANLLVELSSGQTDSTSFTMPEDNRTQIIPRELSKRKFGYLAGVEYSYQFEKHMLQLSLLSDINNNHSGKEFRFAYAHSFNQIFSSTLGFTWKDKNLTDYFYGVNADEIVDDRGAYQAGASFNPFIRFSLNTQTSGADSWRLSLEYQKLDSQITSSPILDDDYVVTFFAGKRFQF